MRLDQRHFPRPKIPRTLPSVTLSLSSVPAHARQARISYRTSPSTRRPRRINLSTPAKPLNTSSTHPLTRACHTQARIQRISTTALEHCQSHSVPNPIIRPQPLQYPPLKLQRTPDLAPTPRLRAFLIRPHRLQCCWTDGPIVWPCSSTPDPFIPRAFLRIAFSRTW